MSVLHNNPGSFLLLVKNLLEYQDHFGDKLLSNKFLVAVSTEISEPSVTQMTQMTHKSPDLESQLHYHFSGVFHALDADREDVKVDWKLSWDDLKVKLRKLYETSEEAFNQFSLGILDRKPRLG